MTATTQHSKVKEFLNKFADLLDEYNVDITVDEATSGYERYVRGIDIYLRGSSDIEDDEGWFSDTIELSTDFDSKDVRKKIQ